MHMESCGCVASIVLCDIAEVHKQDPVVVNYRVQPVRNREDRAVRKPAPDQLLRHVA
jgi:hypothetical protein